MAKIAPLTIHWRWKKMITKLIMLLSLCSCVSMQYKPIPKEFKEVRIITKACPDGFVMAHDRLDRFFCVTIRGIK